MSSSVFAHVRHFIGHTLQARCNFPRNWKASVQGRAGCVRKMDGRLFPEQCLGGCRVLGCLGENELQEEKACFATPSLYRRSRPPLRQQVARAGDKRISEHADEDVQHPHVASPSRMHRRGPADRCWLRMARQSDGGDGSRPISRQ